MAPPMAHLLFLVWASLGPGTATASSVVGEVVAVPARDASRLTVRRDGGGELLVDLAPTTVCLRTRPNATSLEGATPVLPAGAWGARPLSVVVGPDTLDDRRGNAVGQADPFVELLDLGGEAPW